MPKLVDPSGLLLMAPEMYLQVFVLFIDPFFFILFIYLFTSI